MKDRIDFIVGGIQKCGTTSLYRLLRQHPRLVGSSPKEPQFFSRHRRYNFSDEDITAYHRAWLEEGQDFQPDKLYFEASPDSCFLHYRDKQQLFDPLPLVKRYNPEIKIIMVFRDPVERFYSEWRMRRRVHSEGKPWGTAEPFADFFAGAQATWLRRGYQRILYHGCYTSIVTRLLKLFPRQSVLFLKPDDVIDDLAEIERFLGVEPHSYRAIGSAPQKYGLADLPPEIAAKLRSFYLSEIQGLGALTDLDFADWLDV